MGNLQIVVPEEFILDGMCAFPVPGASAEYSLTFYELTALTNPAMLNNIRAEAEPPSTNRRSPGWTDPDGSSHPATYPTVLHSVDFTAFFRSPKLLRGPVELRGTLEADWPAIIGEPPPVHGTIVRCQLITSTTALDSTGKRRARSDTLTDIDGPTGFRSGLVPAGPPRQSSDGWGWTAMVPPQQGAWTRDRGVLVSLSVDS